LLSHLLKADVLILLTDIEGLYTSDPRADASASLITDVYEGDPLMSVDAGASGSNRGSGGMASKLSAARIASWSGVRAVIARADIAGVLYDIVDDIVNGALAQTSSIGTTFHGSDRNLSARQLWVAFASEVSGRVHIDAGASQILVRGTVSLLPAGVTRVDSEFDAGDTIEIISSDGVAIARGSASMSSAQVVQSLGRRSSELEDGFPQVVVHRDALVLLPR
jgi:glutamate 5-kinase